MPNTEKWYNQNEFVEYSNCEIGDFEPGGCSDEIKVPEYRIEAILAHHRKLIVKEIREEMTTLKVVDIEDGVTGLISPRQAFMAGQMNLLARLASLPCLRENE